MAPEKIVETIQRSFGAKNRGSLLFVSFADGIHKVGPTS